MGAAWDMMGKVRAEGISGNNAMVLLGGEAIGNRSFSDETAPGRGAEMGREGASEGKCTAAFGMENGKAAEGYSSAAF